MRDAPEELRATLREAGLRATAQRIAVLGVLRDSHDHLSADRVTEEVRSRLGTVSTQAVYDVLDALTSKGLARRIEPAGSPALFEGGVADNHHHMVCGVCGAVEDIDCVVGAAPCMQASDTRGYVLDEAVVPGFSFRKPSTQDAAEAFGVKAVMMTALKPADEEP